MRRVVHGIDVGHGSHPMRHTNHFSYVVDGSHRIRGVTHRYQLGATGYLSRQIIHVEGAIVVVYFGYANRDATFLESYPGGVVGAVIETSDYDLISWIQFPSNRSADGKGQRGHICTEDHLLRIAGKKISHGDTGAG